MNAIDQLAVGIDRVLTQVPNVLTQCLERAGRDALARTRQRTPVDTGRLRDGWNLSATHTSVTLTNDVPYATHVEEGHRVGASGWKEGVHMAQTSVDEAAEALARDIESQVLSLVRGAMG